MNQVFDRTLVRKHAVRALTQSFDGFLFKRLADQIRERLLDLKRDLETVAEIGVTQTVFTPEFSTRKNVKNNVFVSSLAGKGAAIIDDEFLPFQDNALDALISIGSMHWVNDIPGALIQMRRALKPDGVMMAGFFGGETLSELRDVMMQIEADMYDGVSPRISPFITLQDMAALMQRASFALPVVDYERVTITYENVFKLIKDLRAMGQMNAALKRHDKILSRDFWTRVDARYRELYATQDGRLNVTVDLFYLIGWEPHESQQKPLQPGSAQRRLADVLSTDEIGLGDFTAR